LNLANLSVGSWLGSLQEVARNSQVLCKKMVKLINVLVLASGLAATAFSLERPVQRISGSNKISATFSKQTAHFQHSAPSYLKSAEENTADIVAAKEVPVKAKSLIEKLWNDDTKLTGA
jgi:hypothetical protein